jgi:hypothetical protein
MILSLLLNYDQITLWIVIFSASFTLKLLLNVWMRVSSSPSTIVLDAAAPLLISSRAEILAERRFALL